MDILGSTAIALRCNNCGGLYEISLKQVELSQEALHEDCEARGQDECYPVIYATLVDGRLIDRLRAAWREIEECVRAGGGELRLRPPKDAS